MANIIKKGRVQAPVTSYTPIRSIFDDFFTMSSLMDDGFTRSTMQKYPNPSADIWEEDTSYFVKMALPGIKKDDIDVEVDANYVRIKGGTKKEEEDKEKKFYFRSLESEFEQSFNLPSSIDASKVEASFKDGILELKLPKLEEDKAKKISIN